MEHSLTQDMQVDVSRISLDFHESFFKLIGLHAGFGPIALMAENAGEVTAVGHLDIDFLEIFHLFRRGLPGGRGFQREAMH